MSPHAAARQLEREREDWVSLGCTTPQPAQCDASRIQHSAATHNHHSKTPGRPTFVASPKRRKKIQKNNVNPIDVASLYTVMRTSTTTMTKIKSREWEPPTKGVMTKQTGARHSL